MFLPSGRLQKHETNSGLPPPTPITTLNSADAGTWPERELTCVCLCCMEREMRDLHVVYGNYARRASQLLLLSHPLLRPSRFYPPPSFLLFFRGRLLHSQVTICNWHHGIALSIG